MATTVCGIRRFSRFSGGVKQGRFVCMSDLADLPDDIEALKAMSSSAETIALKAQLIEAQSSRQSADELIAICAFRS
ncbi:MAG: hypothetical protein KKF36_03605 [Alphaproteobacteria bacterium]|nr:hypothetical protein [Alphaproteobacteria bacterium]